MPAARVGAGALRATRYKKYYAYELLQVFWGRGRQRQAPRGCSFSGSCISQLVVDGVDTAEEAWLTKVAVVKATAVVEFTRTHEHQIQSWEALGSQLGTVLGVLTGGRAGRCNGGRGGRAQDIVQSLPQRALFTARGTKLVVAALWALRGFNRPTDIE
jgi:hypothetical protein